MNKANKCSTPIKKLEVISGTSRRISKSFISQEDPVAKKETKVKKNKIGNENKKKMAKNMKDNSMPASATSPYTSEMLKIMVMNSIKSFKKRNGVSFEDIIAYMEQIYEVNMKPVKSYVLHFLKEAVKNGELERISGNGAGEKLKITKLENVKKVSQKLVLKDGMDAAVKKLTSDSATEIKDAKIKKGTHPAIPEIAADSSDYTAVAENFEADLPPSTERVAKISIPNESNSSQKRTRNSKSKAQNEKPKTANVDGRKLKAVSSPENKKPKRKPAHPPTSEMVMDSIKSLKKRNGVTFEDIGKHMEEIYQVDRKALKSHINKFLKKSVKNGALEKFGGAADAEGRYKLKKPDTIKKRKENIAKKAAPKKSAKK